MVVVMYMFYHHVHLQETPQNSLIVHSPVKGHTNTRELLPGISETRRDLLSSTANRIELVLVTSDVSHPDLEPVGFKDGSWFSSVSTVRAYPSPSCYVRRKKNTPDQLRPSARECSELFVSLN